MTIRKIWNSIAMTVVNPDILLLCLIGIPFIMVTVYDTYNAATMTSKWTGDAVVGNIWKCQIHAVKNYIWWYYLVFIVLATSFHIWKAYFNWFSEEVTQYSTLWILGHPYVSLVFLLPALFNFFRVVFHFEDAASKHLPLPDMFGGSVSGSLLHCLGTTTLQLAAIYYGALIVITLLMLTWSVYSDWYDNQTE